MTKPRTPGVFQSYGLEVSQLQEDTRKVVVRVALCGLPMKCSIGFCA